MKLNELPQSVREIAEVIGVETALRLINQLPTRLNDPRPILYVPKRLKADHRLVEILGWHDANKLVQAFGGEILHPAACREVERRILREFAKKLLSIGYRVEMVADKLGVTVRTVRNIISSETTAEENSPKTPDNQKLRNERGAL